MISYRQFFFCLFCTSVRNNYAFVRSRVLDLCGKERAMSSAGSPLRSLHSGGSAAVASTALQCYFWLCGWLLLLPIIRQRWCEPRASCVTAQLIMPLLLLRFGQQTLRRALYAADVYCVLVDFTVRAIHCTCAGRRYYNGRQSREVVWWPQCHWRKKSEEYL